MTERHQRAAAAKCGIAWQRKINTELFEHPHQNLELQELSRQERAAKASKGSRWDPYERFPKKEGTINEPHLVLPEPTKD